LELNPDPFRGPVVYGLDVNSGEGIRTETWLNGIKLAESELGEVGIANHAIQHDLQPGENVAEVRIGPPGTKLDSSPQLIPQTPPANAFATMFLEGDEVRKLGDEMQITTHRFALDSWHGAELTPPVMLPHILRIPFEPNRPFVPAPWSSGEQVAPSEIANSVYDESARLGALLRDGELDAYINAGAVRREHSARCYPAGQSAAELREQNMDFLANLRSQKGFAVKIHSRAQSHFRVQAGGRLFDWLGPEGAPLITIQSDQLEPSPIAVQFSVLEGRLTLVR
jgi:hypothetical protein